MLYTDWLIRLDAEAENAVKSLFDKAIKNQCHENDLLLVLINGFYDKELENATNHPDGKLSPYVFGSGTAGFANETQYKFFHSFRTSYVTNNTREDFLKYNKKESPGWEESYKIITQLELLVYLKFWESDYILKQLFNLCSNLLHSKPYDWYKDMKTIGKKALIEDQIIKSSKVRAPKFYNYVNTCYYRQIRNAAAHSQFYIIGDYIAFTNEDLEDGHHLSSITIAQWEEIFHRTIVLYNCLIKYVRQFTAKYKEEAMNKHFGKQLRIITKDENERYEWIKFLPDADRWIWYTNWEKHYK